MSEDRYELETFDFHGKQYRSWAVAMHGADIEMLRMAALASIEKDKSVKLYECEYNTMTGTYNGKRKLLYTNETGRERA